MSFLFGVFFQNRGCEPSVNLGVNLNGGKFTQLLSIGAACSECEPVNLLFLEFTKISDSNFSDLKIFRKKLFLGVHRFTPSVSTIKPRKLCELCPIWFTLRFTPSSPLNNHLN